MRFFALFLIGAAALAAPARYARLGEFDGPVEVQLSPSSPWIAAERNLPLPESAWLRTGSGARVEIELDDGNSFRLGPDSQGGLSDYTTLSTGQRITLLAIDRGLAYFSGENRGPDSIVVAMPGAQLIVGRPTQVRIEVTDVHSQVYVLHGSVSFSSTAATVDLGQRQTARVEPEKPSRFFLDREFEDIELDRWNTARVKAVAGPVAALHVGQRYGLADLDSAGEWLETTDWGLVWKPKVTQTWVPFRNGRWRWLDRLGYTWVSDDEWGWLPNHYGRWAYIGEVGWVWSPSPSDVFHPGDVYWMHAAKLAGWGPLAPTEEWQPSNLPRWYLDANTTFAAYAADTDTIDPAGFEGRPKEPLRTAAFTAALPSPAFVAATLDARRPAVRANVLITPVEIIEPPPPPPAKPPKPTPPPAPVIIVTPPPPAEEIFVPVPVYETAIIYSPVLQAPPASVPPSAPRSGSAPPSKSQRSLARPVASPGEHGGVKRPRDRAESDLATRVFNDVRDSQWRKAVVDIDEWVQRYPESDYADDRLYYLAQANHYLRQSDRVLQYGAMLMAKGNDARLDARQTLDLTYLVTTEAAAMKRLNRQQATLGRAAAQSLLDMAVPYFADANRPAETKPADWLKLRQAIEGAARAAIKALANHG